MVTRRDAQGFVTSVEEHGQAAYFHRTFWRRWLGQSRIRFFAFIGYRRIRLIEPVPGSPRVRTHEQLIIQGTYTERMTWQRIPRKAGA